MKEYLAQIHQTSDQIIDEYTTHWTPIDVPKKTILTAPGEIERYLYYVKSGIQKSYFVSDNKSHVLAFTHAPSFTTIADSFIGQIPSDCFLETITDSQLLRLSYQKHQQLIKDHRELETLFRKLTELLLVDMVERHKQLMASDMESRFKFFFQKYAYLANLISHKDIASYLRIDATNFSKLINRVKI